MALRMKTKRNHKASQNAIAQNRAELFPDFSEARANLMAVLASATDDDIDAGADWYGLANRIATDAANTFGGTLRQGCGIMAALSPSSPWDANVEGTYHVCQHGTAWYCQSDVFNVRALAIRADRAADPLGTLGGRKVRSFYRNILDPQQFGPVTIDRHAFSILCGRPLRSNDKRLERRGMYVMAAAIYRSVARELGLPTSTVQAVAWIVWRNRYDATWRAQHRNDLDEMF